ncbi:aminotransferase [Salmonella enterica subsp. enterica serovar Choleraesuis]|nr:aminotransferase [Salmonella enterica subsp. enterica serovar Choleraesuis]
MFNFSTPVDRHGTWCTQWDYVADRFGAADLLPFTISDMDFPSAPCIQQALTAWINNGVLGYSRWQNAEFSGAIQGWMQRRFSSNIDPQNLVYGPSVIYMAGQLIRQWSEPGDGVAVHTPAYDAFYKTINGNQRQVLAVPLAKNRDGGWQCDMSLLENTLARPDCKILLLCSPHNPTGKVWSREELTAMAALCRRHGVRVISDEIHMDMTWGDARHTPWDQVAQSDWALITSASKSFNVPALTGAWGLISNPQDKQNYLAALKERDGLSSPAVLALVAQIAAYNEGAPWLDALRDYLEANLRHIALTLNTEFPALNWQPPQATYLAWIDLSPLGLDDKALQQELIEHQKVAIMPGYTYGEEGAGFIRLNAGCQRAKLDEGLKRLIAGIKALQRR